MKHHTEANCHAIVARTRLPFGTVSAVLAALDIECGNTPDQTLNPATPAPMVYVTSQGLSPRPCESQACHTRHPRHHCQHCARHYPVAALADECKHGS